MHAHECAHASLWHWAAWECCMANHAQLQICLCACLCVYVWVRHVIEPFEGQYPSVPTHHCWLLWFFSPLTFFFLCFKMASPLSSCSLQAEAKQEFWSTKHWEPEMATTHFVSVVIQLCSAVPPPPLPPLLLPSVFVFGISEKVIWGVGRLRQLSCLLRWHL